MKKILSLMLFVCLTSCLLVGAECQFTKITFDEKGVPKKIECIFRFEKSETEMSPPIPVIVTKTRTIRLGNSDNKPINISKDPKYFEFIGVMDVSEFEPTLGDLSESQWRFTISSRGRKIRGNYIEVMEAGGNLIGFSVGDIDKDPIVKAYLSK